MQFYDVHVAEAMFELEEVIHKGTNYSEKSTRNENLIGWNKTIKANKY